MAILTIDSEHLRSYFISGVHALETSKAWINDLNVFPVPDGDTGTNMCMTLESAVNEVQGVQKETVQTLAKAISFGSLRGARGNSGVIMSQLLRGFCKEIQDKAEIDHKVLAKACTRAVETAYKAVMKPKEGTILTVSRGIAEKLAELAEEETDLTVLVQKTLVHGDEVLEHTPELLPVLKEAGVVDSGGQGLMVFLKGVYSAMLGKEIPAPEGTLLPPSGGSARASVNTENISTSDIKFGYCTEFLINLERPLSEAEEDGFRAYLESLGDSIVMVADDEIVKVHVHTNDPGLAIQKALTFGGLTNMKIDNMRFEHREKLIADASRIAAEEKQKKEAETRQKSVHKATAFISTCAGAGMKEIFTSLGVDMIVEGGQTMNPSTDDILKAVEAVNADTVFILPNNSNIILAAEQARKLAEGCKVVVIPTKTIPQGISAMMNYMPEDSAEVNAQRMKEGLSAVRSSEVTYAVRNTHIAGKEISEGDIMGLGGPDGLYAVGQGVTETTMATVAEMIRDDSTLVTLYFGEGVTADEAEDLRAKLAEAYPDAEFEVFDGGQPIYYYIISVE